MSLFCLICSLSALSPGCYCWCPTNSAPANSRGGGCRQELGVPFYLNPHLSCWGSTNWKAVVTALASLPPQAAAAPPGGGENESVLQCRRTPAALEPIYPCRVTFSPRANKKRKKKQTGATVTHVSATLGLINSDYLVSSTGNRRHPSPRADLNTNKGSTNSYCQTWRGSLRHPDVSHTWITSSVLHTKRCQRNMHQWSESFVFFVFFSCSESLTWPLKRSQSSF